MKSNRTSNIILLMLAVMFTVVLSSITINADVNWPSVASNKYCEFVAGKTIYVYKNTSCTTRGTSSPSKSYNAYIAKNDVCYIYRFTNSYFQVNYPTSSGRKTGYIKRSDFVVSSNVIRPIECVTSKGNATTYKTNGGATYGYTEKNDTVYNLGKSGVYTAIIYTAKSGNRAYKYGFVKTSDYNNIINCIDPAPNPTNAAEAIYNFAKSHLGKKYGEFKNLGFHYRAWCADFVSWCAKSVGQSDAIPWKAAVSDLRTAIRKAGGKEYSKSTIIKGNYTPQRGDIIIFKSNGASHVGIVDYASNNTIYYIDGNNITYGNADNSSVQYSNCSYSYSQFTCVLKPNYR